MVIIYFQTGKAEKKDEIAVVQRGFRENTW